MKGFLVAVSILLAVLIGVAAIYGLWLWGTYNNMVSLQTEATKQLAEIDSQMQRRFDLIPNLVGSVQGYLTQEQKIFGDLAQARANYAGSAPGTMEKVAAGDQLNSVLGRLMVIVENYPNLKSSDVVLAFMSEQEGTENRIQIARRRYNEAVTDFNREIRGFPGNTIAKTYGFEEMELFKAQQGAEVAPKVELNTNVNVK